MERAGGGGHYVLLNKMAQLKSIRRNVISSQALTAGTTTSATQKANFERGIRFYITVSAVTATGSTDTFNLCCIPPAGGSAVVLAGFSGANLLSTAGVWVVDYYPSATLPATFAAGSHFWGVAGIAVPSQFAAQCILGAGNAATIAVDAEMIP